MTIAFGGFYSYKLTNISSHLYEDNYGVRALIGLNFPYEADKSSALSFEVGYQYGYPNLLKSKGTELYESAAILLVGFRFASSIKRKSVESYGAIPTVPYRLATPPEY